jgi:hypothetical protein
MAYEREFLAELRDIARSLRALRGLEKPEEGVVAQEPIRTFAEPQKGVQRLTEPSATPEGEWEAYLKYQRRSGSGQVLSYAAWRAENQAKRLQETGEVSPRLVEKLLNPEEN